MNIKITSKEGITLKTKDTYIREDISVAVDDSLMGITPTGTYEVTDNGEYDITEYAKVNVNVASGGSEETNLPTNLSYMFYNNNNHTNLDKYRIEWKKYTSKVTTMQYMFNGNTKLQVIPPLNTDRCNSFKNMCYNCYSLLKLDISKFSISGTSYTQNWLSGCYSLKALIIRNVGNFINLNSNALQNCYHLTGTVNATYNPNGDKDGYIYVPRSMVDTLKSATNWSAFADQIRALEDYTIDGTTTGELDETKI